MKIHLLILVSAAALLAPIEKGAATIMDNPKNAVQYGAMNRIEIPDVDGAAFVRYGRLYPLDNLSQYNVVERIIEVNQQRPGGKAIVPGAPGHELDSRAGLEARDIGASDAVKCGGILDANNPAEARIERSEHESLTLAAAEVDEGERWFYGQRQPGQLLIKICGGNRLVAYRVNGILAPKFKGPDVDVAGCVGPVQFVKVINRRLTGEQPMPCSDGNSSHPSLRIFAGNLPWNRG